VKAQSWWLLMAVAGCSRSASDRIVATGTIEMIEVDVAPQVPARVVAVRVEEGEAVRLAEELRGALV